jgi:hypothetical protein
MVFDRNVLECLVSERIEGLVEGLHTSNACAGKRKLNRASILPTRNLFYQTILRELFDSPTGPTLIQADASGKLGKRHGTATRQFGQHGTLSDGGSLTARDTQALEMGMQTGDIAQQRARRK